jgi:2'-5' RNA ligase
MHLTLAFLGDIPDALLPDAIAATTAGAAGHRAFTASLDHVGRFPAHGAPRVVWLGVGEGAAELGVLAGSVRAALAAKRLPFDAKPFEAHVTLARVRERATPDDLRAVAAAVTGGRVGALAFDVAGVLLVESELGARGPRYTPRAAVPLGAGTA